MSSVFSTAISGMNAAAKRMLNAATNIVNASSTGKISSAENEKATSYMPTDVISVSYSVGDHNFGVGTQTVPRDPAYSVAMDVHSPFANEEGLIAVPNVDLTKELVETKLASLAYKASVKVIEAEKKNQETLIDTLL